MTTTTREQAGKSKDVIRKDGKTFFEFTDRITAFDGLKKDEYPDKGEVCCRLSAYWFEILEKEGIPTHFRAFVPPNVMEVEYLEIIPIEVIWRNFVAGSLLKRYEGGETPPSGIEPRLGAKIPGGICEFTTKFEEIDRSIDEQEILDNRWLTREELDSIRESTRRVNDIMSTHLLEKGIILADFKIEFGKNLAGEILLADEVGTPDGCRFWDAGSHGKGRIESLDKDVYRYEKGSLSDAYATIMRRICG
jgi:phosphoribosylaminoimidazole-succinocarboxamide synthase